MLSLADTLCWSAVVRCCCWWWQSLRDDGNHQGYSSYPEGDLLRGKLATRVDEFWRW